MNPLTLTLALGALLIRALPTQAQASPQSSQVVVQAASPAASPATSSATSSAAFPASSSWRGAVTLPNQKELRVELRLQQVNAQWQGSIAIPLQGAKDLSLKDIQIEGQDLRFSIADVKGNPTFVGRFDAASRTVKGEFSQAPAKMPFELKQDLGAADSQASTPVTELAPAGTSNTSRE